LKAGLEYNKTNTTQTFIGFANGRYLFDSVSGFLNYARNPKFVECSDGSSSQTGNCPAGASPAGPVLLYLQNVPLGGRTVDQAGTQSIDQKEPAAFIQDKWQPLPNLTVSLGLRWEAQIEPDPITPPDQVFYSKFIGTTSMGQAFPSDGKLPSDYTMFQPRLGIVWDPNKDGKTVVRASGGIFAARVPGLDIASPRSTNGTISYSYFALSAFGPGAVPAYPNILNPATLPAIPDHPQVYVWDEHVKNPRTYQLSAAIEREVAPDIGVSLKYNYAHTVDIGRWVDRNDALLGSPWATGLGAGGTNGLGQLTTFESTGHSVYNGITLGLVKRYTNNFEFQAFYTLSWDKSDDDNERDPFTYRYAKITNLGPEYGYSDRDQRHRLNAYVLWQAPGQINVNASWQYRSAQPISICGPSSINASCKPGDVASGPSDRINTDGSVTERNLGRKDNQFNSVNLRISRPFVFGAVTVEPIAEVFNLFNSKNLKNPGAVSLLFNFDGTVQSGLGDPRQAQLGVRVVF
ncbi:MAG: TonB-dependent receptor domain-containing protein, partial [Thermoanaerobaculia bacterium]